MSKACPFCGRSGGDLVGEGNDAFCATCAALVDVPAALRHLPDKSGSMPVRMGRYEIVRELGQGGTGTVYEARDPELRRNVALKVLDEKGLQAGPLQRFLREARVLAKVRHPNVVEIHELGHEGEATFIAMDFVEGVPFPGTSDRGEAVRRLVAVARALEHIHGQGIVHRDLKPSNILVGPDGRPVIMDFGIARDTEASTVMTGPGAVIGTPGYMAPEQVTGETREADARADVYALGVLLFEALAGRLPYAVGGVKEYAEAIRRGRVPGPREVRSDVPAPLDAVCRKALSIAPSGRYASAGDFAVALEAAADARPHRRARRAIVTAGAVGLVALVIAVAAWPSRAPQPVEGPEMDEAVRRWTRVMNGAMPFESALAELLECEKLLRRAGEPGLLPLGRLYAELGRHDEAAAELDAALARDPASLEALMARGGGIVTEQIEIQFDRKAFPRVARGLAELLASREAPRMDSLAKRITGPGGSLARAYGAIARGEWEDARRALDSATGAAVPPRVRDEVQFLHAVVASLADEGRGPLAGLARTEEDSAFSLGEREVWVTMIRHSERKGAKQRLGGGLSSRTRVHGALLRVEASVWEAKGDRARALEALGRAASSSPGYLLARLHRARLLREAGDRGGAAREIEEIARRASALPLRAEALSEIRS
jgi:tetratricopeptide (TPR) repeat protein/predicted Ser/Thr protein kinase